MEWPHPAVLVPILLVLFALTFLRFYYVRRGLDSERERERRTARAAVGRYSLVYRALTVLAPLSLVYTVLYAVVAADASGVFATVVVVTFLTCAHFLIHERYDPDEVEETLSPES